MRPILASMADDVLSASWQTRYDYTPVPTRQWDNDKEHISLASLFEMSIKTEDRKGIELPGFGVNYIFNTEHGYPSIDGEYDYTARVLKLMSSVKSLELPRDNKKLDKVTESGFGERLYKTLVGKFKELQKVQVKTLDFMIWKGTGVNFLEEKSGESLKMNLCNFYVAVKK